MTAPRLALVQACALLGGIYPAGQIARYYLASRQSLSALLASPEFWIDDFVDWLALQDATPTAWDTLDTDH